MNDGNFFMITYRNLISNLIFRFSFMGCVVNVFNFNDFLRECEFIVLNLVMYFFPTSGILYST